MDETQSKVPTDREMIERAQLDYLRDQRAICPLCKGLWWKEEMTPQLNGRHLCPICVYRVSKYWSVETFHFRPI